MGPPPDLPAGATAESAGRARPVVPVGPRQWARARARGASGLRRGRRSGSRCSPSPATTGQAQARSVFGPRAGHDGLASEGGGSIEPPKSGWGLGKGLG